MNILVLLKFNFLVILIPLILANTTHMILVKKNSLPWLAIPINSLWFGANKTWRGLVLLILLGEVFFLLTNGLWSNLWQFSYPGYGVGATLGLVYGLSELPNSWIKRRMGVTEGSALRGKRWITTIMDKTDSALGVALFTAFLIKTNYNSIFLSYHLSFESFSTIWIILILLVQNSLIHLIFSAVLVGAGIKKQF